MHCGKMECFIATGLHAKITLTALQAKKGSFPSVTAQRKDIIFERNTRNGFQRTKNNEWKNASICLLPPNSGYPLPVSYSKCRRKAESKVQ